MPMHVCNGAMLQCTGAVPPGTAPLTVVPINRKLISNQPAANIMDHVPLLNIPSFGACMSPTSPLFIAATSAALGVPTPVPCLPVTPAPWMPGSISPPVLLADQPALNDISKLQCVMGGMISIVYAGQSQKFVS